jgi:hypothetical protein
MLRQRVDHRDADAVQAAGDLVGLVAELSACVQAREDELDAGQPFLEPSLWTVTSISLQWPASASSTLLSMTSCARWLGLRVSVYMPGRRRTGSSPVRTSMSEAV